MRKKLFSSDLFGQSYLEDKRLISEYMEESSYRIRTKDYYLGKLENVWFDSRSWKISFLECFGFKNLESIDNSVLIESRYVSPLKPYSNTLCIDKDLIDINDEILIKNDMNPSQKRSFIKSIITNKFLSNDIVYDFNSLLLNENKSMDDNGWSNVKYSSLTKKNIDIMSVSDLKSLSIITKDNMSLEISSLLINFSKWQFVFLVFDIPYWFSFRKVVCPISFLNKIDLKNTTASIELPFEAIKKAQERNR